MINAEAVKQATSFNLSEEFVAKLTEEISKKVTSNIIEYFDDQKRGTSDENEDEQDVWVISEDTKEMYCKPCMLYSQDKDRPSHLDKYYKAQFGHFLIRALEDRSKNTRKDQKKQRKVHTKSPLHLWCMQKRRNDLKEKKSEEEADVKASECIASNAIFCLKNNLSATDFIKMNDKDQLCMPNFPTKNDGIQQFHTIRDIAYDRMVSIAQEKMSGIKNASFSLDKVTVKNIPYTVIITYYFWNGKIHVFLNSIHRMSSSEYSGESTARMVGEDLMHSLRLTRQQVGSLFTHCVYDGVYATKGERKHGGGSLSLRDHFARWCGLEPENFSGAWDLGHLLQLVYSDALKENKHVKEFNSQMYRIMSDWKSGQAGLRFHELGQELHFATLTNKSQQETRWVRAELRSIQALFRNIPLYAAICSKEEEVCLKNSDVTGQSIQMKERENICNGKFIAFGTGLAQILEVYAKCSLDVQNAQLHPSQCPEKLNDLISYLENLLEWKWSNEDLKMAGIGNPSKIISNLRSGLYKPFVSDGAKIQAARQQNTNNKQFKMLQSSLASLGEIQLCEDEDEIYAKMKKEDIVEGEVPIIFTEESLKVVESRLQSIVQGLIDSFQKRVTVPAYIEKSKEAFVALDWYDKEMTTDEEIQSKISEVLESIISTRKSDFEECIEEIVPGYKVYLMFTKENTEKEDFSAAKNYKQFCQQFTMIETSMFRDFYEHINVRSYSEAICETIGNILNCNCWF